MTLEHLMAFRPHEIVLHPLPMDMLLRDSLFYPNCGLDGEIIRSCNQHFSERGICSFVYCDPYITQEQLLDNLDTFSHYKVLATRSFNPFQYHALDGPVDYDPQYAPYGRWTVYAKDTHNYVAIGPERFSVLFFGGTHMFMDNIFGLYEENRIPIKAFVGGPELNNPNSPSYNILSSFYAPELIYFKESAQQEDLEDDSYSFDGDADIHPRGGGTVTIWRRDNLPEW